jgi:hypothetical protein
MTLDADSIDTDIPVTVQQWLEVYECYSRAADSDLDKLEQELDALEVTMTQDERVQARNLAGNICKRIENEDSEGFRSN